MHNELLKRYEEWVSKFLYITFNVSLRTGMLPNDWRAAKVIPVRKNEDWSNASNYRTISLTSTSCKIGTQFFHTLLNIWKKIAYSLITNTDFGSRSQLLPN